MERKSAKSLIGLIIKSISDKPKSIQEVAESCDSNWESVRIYLESLKNAGIVQEIADGNRRVFLMNKINTVEKNPDTYFGLPVKAEDEKIIRSIFSFIRTEWKKATGKEPGRTQVQKCMARVNKVCDIGLPFGWYLHGPVCVEVYDTEKTYEYSGLSEKIKKNIIEVVNDYSQITSSYNLKIRCYAEEKNPLYSAKESIIQLFSIGNFSKKSIDEMNANFQRIVNNLPPIFDNFDKAYLYVINDFYGLIMRIMAMVDDNELKQIKAEICESFNELWKMIALFNYFNDLLPYYEKNYSREMEMKFFLPEMNSQRIAVIECMKNLSDYIPKENENIDETYKKVRDALNDTKNA